MATHFYDDCPGMNDGDEVLDKEGLDLEDWVYDCRTCQYVEHVEETAWAGGFYNRLQAALSRLDELQTAINVGHSKLRAFRLLMREWGDPEMVSDPGYLPLLIMTSEELMVYQCPECQVGTSYSRTEDDVDVWNCGQCGGEVRIPVEDRVG